MHPIGLPTQRNNFSGMTRRQFARFVGSLTALGLVDPLVAAQSLHPDRRRLSWLANRTATVEGSWNLENIEGRIPEELEGTLYRVGPGQKENHGVTLRHLFDGDAFIMGFSLRDGKAALRAQYVATPERLDELREGRMIYNEFGTLAPREGQSRSRMKNQPNVNVIAWDGRLLGLSEGGHPAAIDSITFAFQGYWDFHGTLPAMVPMTAHPKFDPKTGEGYMYGMRQGFPPAILVYRMDKDGKLKQLHEVPQTAYFMIHDMILTREHIVFVIPPVKMINPMDFLSGKSSLGDAIRFFENEPLRIVILRRDGTGKPVTVEQPPSVVFHHGNGFEREDGKLVIDSMLAADGSILKALKSWSEDNLPQTAPPILTRLVLDPSESKIESRTELSADQEFPRFDSRRSGEDIRYLYTGESILKDDPLAFTLLVRNDLHRVRGEHFEAGPDRAFGEPVFVARGDAEDEGWILVLAYDAPRDETCLEIRDAATLEMQARIWTGHPLPLGFHGNFVRESAVAVGA